MKFTTPMDHVRKNCSYGSIQDEFNTRCTTCTCNEEKELYKGESVYDQHPFWEPALLNVEDYAQMYRPWTGARK